jgi:hypothetical protein
MQVLKRVERQRQNVVDATDVVEDPPSDEDEETAAAREAAKARRVPSKEAMDKFEDYRECCALAETDLDVYSFHD